MASAKKFAGKPFGRAIREIAIVGLCSGSEREFSPENYSCDEHSGREGGGIYGMRPKVPKPLPPHRKAHEPIEKPQHKAPCKSP